jgi:putative transcriptional regulator
MLPPEGGRLLVATPFLDDPHFARTVVYLLEHDGGGTVGVVLNRPSHTPTARACAASSMASGRSISTATSR